MKEFFPYCDISVLAFMLKKKKKKSLHLNASTTKIRHTYAHECTRTHAHTCMEDFIQVS